MHYLIAYRRHPALVRGSGEGARQVRAAEGDRQKRGPVSGAQSSSLALPRTLPPRASPLFPAHAPATQSPSLQTPPLTAPPTAAHTPNPTPAPTPAAHRLPRGVRRPRPRRPALPPGDALPGRRLLLHGRLLHPAPLLLPRRPAEVQGARARGAPPPGRTRRREAWPPRRAPASLHPPRPVHVRVRRRCSRTRRTRSPR